MGPSPATVSDGAGLPSGEKRRRWDRKEDPGDRDIFEADDGGSDEEGELPAEEGELPTSRDEPPRPKRSLAPLSPGSEARQRQESSKEGGPERGAPRPDARRESPRDNGGGRRRESARSPRDDPHDDPHERRAERHEGRRDESRDRRLQPSPRRRREGERGPSRFGSEKDDPYGLERQGQGREASSRARGSRRESPSGGRRRVGWDDEPSPRRRYDEPSPRRRYDEREPSPRRRYDEDEPSPRGRYNRGERSPRGVRSRGVGRQPSPERRSASPDLEDEAVERALLHLDEAGFEDPEEAERKRAEEQRQRRQERLKRMREEAGNGTANGPGRGGPAPGGDAATGAADSGGLAATDAAGSEGETRASDGPTGVAEGAEPAAAPAALATPAVPLALAAEAAASPPDAGPPPPPLTVATPLASDSSEEDDLFATTETSGGAADGAYSRAAGPGAGPPSVEARAGHAVPSSAGGNAPEAAPEAAGLSDNFDDAEGYYRYQVGELLGGRYRALATLGRGVFSAVVRAQDVTAAGVAAAGAAVGEEVEAARAAGGAAAAGPAAPASALGRPPLPGEVAVKLLRANETMSRAGRMERAILRKLAAADPSGAKRCVRLLGSFEHRGHLCLVFEPMDSDLRQLTRRYGRDVGLAGSAVRSYARQLFAAAAHLEACGVVHADVKPDNVLVDSTRTRVCLADFGSALLGGSGEITPYLVSRFYRAPEVILGLPYSHAIDIWSLACVIFELATGKVLFPGASNNEMLRLVQETKGPFPKKLLRKGMFTPRHFDTSDPTLPFCVIEADPVTGDVLRRVVRTFEVSSARDGAGAPDPAARPRRDLPTLLRGAFQERKKLAQLVDLLERCTALDPDRRMRPREALRHPFIAEPWPQRE